MHTNVIMKCSCALPKTAYCIIMVLCNLSRWSTPVITLTISSNLRHSWIRTIALRSYILLQPLVRLLSHTLVTKLCRKTQSDRTFFVTEIIRAGKRTTRETWLRTVERTDTRDSFCCSESPRHVAAFGGVSVFPPGGNDDEWRGSGAKRRACGFYPENANVASHTMQWFHLLRLISRNSFAFAMIATNIVLTLVGISHPHL